MSQQTFYFRQVGIGPGMDPRTLNIFQRVISVKRWTDVRSMLGQGEIIYKLVDKKQIKQDPLWNHRRIVIIHPFDTVRSYINFLSDRCPSHHVRPAMVGVDLAGRSDPGNAGYLLTKEIQHDTLHQPNLVVTLPTALFDRRCPPEMFEQFIEAICGRIWANKTVLQFMLPTRESLVDLTGRSRACEFPQHERDLMANFDTFRPIIDNIKAYYWTGHLQYDNRTPVVEYMLFNRSRKVLKSQVPIYHRETFDGSLSGCLDY